MKEIRIADKIISHESDIFLIGEIGINHNGSIDIAKQIIDLANICSVDAVKFQKRTPELAVPDHMRNRIKETPWGEMTYFDYKKKIEFNREVYEIIDKYCKEKNIIWFASPWDVASVDFLEDFNVPCYKVPSAHLTNKELLQRIKDIKKPIILSTGMSTEGEIEKAVHYLKNNDLILMHCNSSYPAAHKELNLKYIPRLIKKYPDVIIGYSGHEEGISASLVAASLGAKVIERHITIDRAMWGTDQGASLEFSGLRRLVRDLKNYSVWLGDGQKRVYESEEIVKKKLRIKDTL